MKLTEHATCNECLALNAMKWKCVLGYKVAALKVFKPMEPCPKPTTDAELASCPAKP